MILRPRPGLPHPLLSITLFVVWLLLVNSVSAFSILSALVLALAVPLFTNALWPDHPQIRRPLRLVAYGLRLLRDIGVANLHVARLILGSPARLRPAFIRMPLELRDESAITLLASTISLTPGTVSANLSGDRRTLLVHSFDLEDEATAVAHIKERYERRIREIFE